MNVGLETTQLEQCPACDTNGDGVVTINEIITAVNIGLGLLRPSGCDGGLPTETPTQGSETPTPSESTPTPSDATPTPTNPFGVCADCHEEIAEHMTETGGHGETGFDCESCHDESLGPPGPGHRNIPACRSCHLEQMTHEPAEEAVGRTTECAVCHNPHGSTNLTLVNTLIEVPQNEVRDVVFSNTAGLADGSFASASAPGTGICEICHTSTEFYRSDGSGESHFTATCTVCHTHPQGFEPR